MKQEIQFLDDEYWYGGKVQDGYKLPFYEKSEYTCDLINLSTDNQAVPLFLSNKGRYIFSKKGFILKVKSGKIFVEGEDFELNSDGKTLRDAYINAQSKYQPIDTKIPNKYFFATPQYNTWIELLYEQTQENVLKYAKSILENGFPTGILMIDDNWFTSMGSFEFDFKKFPNPKETIHLLKSYGFKVMLWVSPFISPDSYAYRKALSKNLLILKEGKPAIIEWWNGFSACFDLSNPYSVDYLATKLEYLMQEYGVDGFKFDAGDASFYSDSKLEFYDKTCNENKQCELWAEFGAKYEFNEFRACFNHSGSAIIQRLADKFHEWDYRGILSLIPNTLNASIIGHRYCCPDMIGGGDYRSFPPYSTSFEEQLYVRYCQCATLMPMMQFSLASWRVLSLDNQLIVKECVDLHQKFSDYILALVKRCAQSGEPIVRSMEYCYPNCGYAKISDQFMLGDKFLVAPVIQQNQEFREVILPKGEWKYDNKIYQGNKTVLLKVDIKSLPYFELIS